MALTVLKNMTLGPVASPIIHNFHNDSVRLVRLSWMISLRAGRSRWPFLRQLKTPGSSNSGLMRIGRHLIGPSALVLSRGIAASEWIRRGWPPLSPFAAGWGRWWGGWIEHLFSRLGGSGWPSESLLASMDSPRCNT